jgi:hypothetical protein
MKAKEGKSHSPDANGCFPCAHVPTNNLPPNQLCFSIS